MRHLKKGKKFGRLTARRKSFSRNLVNDLVRAGKIETTEARAKMVRPAVEKLITIARRQTLASRRLIISRVHNAKIAQKLYEDLGVRYKERAGGYTRVTKLGKSRKRDGSALARIEFV